MGCGRRDGLPPSERWLEIGSRLEGEGGSIMHGGEEARESSARMSRAHR